MTPAQTTASRRPSERTPGASVAASKSEFSVAEFMDTRLTELPCAPEPYMLQAARDKMEPLMRNDPRICLRGGGGQEQRRFHSTQPILFAGFALAVLLS